MKLLRPVLRVALAALAVSVTAAAGTALARNTPAEAPAKREVVTDYGVPGSTTATHVYIDPIQIGPGKYFYAYADEDAMVISYQDDSRQQGGRPGAVLR